MSEQGEVPSPNAFDFYVEAGRKIREALTRDDRYMRAIEPPETVDAGLPPEPTAFLDLDDRTPEEQRDIVARCADGLHILREGTLYPCMIPWETASSKAMFTVLTPLRDTAKVLRIESDIRASDGEFAKAMDGLLDVVQLGTDIQRGGLVIHSLVGSAINGIGVVSAWDLVGSLNPDKARASARRVEEILARSWPLAETIVCEKRFGRLELESTLRHPTWKLKEAFSADPLELDDRKGGIGFWSALRGFTRLLFLRKRQVLAEFDRFMDEQIARTQMPFAEAIRMPDLEPGVPFDWMFDYSTGSFRVSSENSRAQRALLALSLALRAYAADAGRYPETLSDLVPDYLCDVPFDPFSDEAPLRYRADGDGYVLYSVGPDGMDDGGKAIENPCSDEELSSCFCVGRHRVMPDSKGDVVAGVNW